MNAFLIATLLCFSEHIGRYDRVFEKYKEKGILVLGFDFKGHGNTFVEDGNLNVGHVFHANVQPEESIKRDFTFFYSTLEQLLGPGNEKIPRFLASRFWI